MRKPIAIDSGGRGRAMQDSGTEPPDNTPHSSGSARRSIAGRRLDANGFQVIRALRQRPYRDVSKQYGVRVGELVQFLVERAA